MQGKIMSSQTSLERCHDFTLHDLTLLVYHHQNSTNAYFLVAEAVKAFEALAPVANSTKRLTRSATGSRKWWRSARSVHNFDFFAKVVSMMVAFLLICPGSTFGQIVKPNDAPKPLSPAETSQRFTVPPGFRVELVASEPLVLEPSGVCWDERGDLYVCELHGYNLEGQYDIEELNKTGQLDRVVRRIQADERHKKAAEAGTYGTIKRLKDTDGDGRMDIAEVWADRLPACLGICPANGGIIAACQTQILFLADRNGDGKAETKEILFGGFKPSILERSINSPQLGPDNWIYFGRGAGGGTISGKYLSKVVELSNTDFRIKSDGTAIEPIVGNTGTMGFAFTESGDRFVISTGTPGIFVAPIEWRYLARNPDVAAPTLQQSATTDQRVYPTSRPHPWRTRRADDPGFAKLYTDRYGIQESAPNGYFTSACSPLVYQDNALPGLLGQLLACEPAQNFVHRAVIERAGSQLTLHRDPSESKSEFLSSSDSWFHAIALSHAPDGSIYIVDFYREIIEDYSAIPRYLQQQYGLIAGKDHGRIWRLTHEAASLGPLADMSQLSPEQLAAEVGSAHYWRRTTARRLLIERRPNNIASILVKMIAGSSEPAWSLNAMHTLHGLDALGSSEIILALAHSDASVRRQALRFAERSLDVDPTMLTRVLALASDVEPLVRLQLALSLGETRDARALNELADLCRKHGDEKWMTTAILSAVPARGGDLLSELVRLPSELGQAQKMLEPLCTAIANRRDPTELSNAIDRIAALDDRRLQTDCVRGMRTSFKRPVAIALTETANNAIRNLSRNSDEALRSQALSLIKLLSLETAAERQARLEMSKRQLSDIQLSVDERLAAVAVLADEDDAAVTAALLNALKSSTPRVRDAILSAVLTRRDRISALLDAVEAKTVSGAWISAVQKSTLFDAKEPSISQRAASLLKATEGANREMFSLYAKALEEPRDANHGQQVFREKCASCHQAHGLGHAVGPDLNAEFQRAEETILKDVLAPSDSISAGYTTYSILTKSDQVFSGLLASESPTSLTLRQAEAKQETVLRKDVEELRAMSVSMMPEDMFKTVGPKDLADLLSWLRHPPTRITLLDENVSLADALNEGAGTAEFITTDKHDGLVCLKITPLQRCSSRIQGWSFSIREKPAAGEFRFIRFAWKSAEADGVMLEFAADGRWPPSDKPLRRYHAGRNTTGWQSKEVDPAPPREWTVVTRDLWQDMGDFTLTGIAPTAMESSALFDRIELLQNLAP